MAKRKREESEVTDRFASLSLSALNQAGKESVIKLALAALAQRHRVGRRLESPGQVREFLRLKLFEQKNEVFGAMFLDTRHRVLEVAEMFQGTIDGAAVYPRVVVQRAMALNAAAVVFFHNHPSGVAEPSSADQAITRRLIDALTLVDVRVLDHFVICAGESVSMAERGLI